MTEDRCDGTLTRVLTGACGCATFAVIAPSWFVPASATSRGRDQRAGDASARPCHVAVAGAHGDRAALDVVADAHASPPHDRRRRRAALERRPVGTEGGRDAEPAADPPAAPRTTGAHAQPRGAPAGGGAPRAGRDARRRDDAQLRRH